ncbi:receptor-like protein EIX2 [Lycium ferocissimum]|uniref:receptor-like protein EIX2 n=1 Tax=Lycium ferocissimum TaxID=112874 RepID=UPI0028169D8C|nr:receptor-like protein EIX2 [Lycium ferocissimum]
MKVLAITLWVLLFFILTNTKFVVCVGICRESEQRALESLKKEVDDPSDLLSSWVVGKDCCEWEGVVCNNLTRHVIELHIISDWEESSYVRINSLEWLPSLLSLEHLEMRYVDLSNATNWLQVINMLPSLVDLSLSNCELNHIQPLLHHNFSSLETLDLYGNNFNSPVPNWVFNLASLVSLNLSYSNFTGPFPDGPVNLTSLTSFQASYNSFNCLLPRWLFDLSNLEYIDLSSSGLEGAIPSKSENITKLKNLDLSHNMLSGKLPNLIGKLKKLEYLDLSDNLFDGEVSELFNAKNGSYKLEILNLGENDLSEEIPDCWMNWPNLTVLILRDNNLIGGIPRSMKVLSNLRSLDFRRNRLNGPFPSSLGNCTKLHKIDLAENEFVGKLPSWLGLRFPTLIVLSLRSNKFNGELPQELCHLKDLQILDLANNAFVGVIPRCIGNFSAMVKGKKELEDLELNYSLYLGVLRESAMVMTKGNMYQYDTILALFTSMDMSSNYFSGDIPISLTRLEGLRSFNFSKNNLTGGIPNGIGDMKALESVDLSENQLYGQIPQSFSSLFTLSYLNLSDNNLSGMIPLSTQLQSFDPTSFQGNKLCGLPLLVNCSSGGKTPNHEYEEDENDKDEVDWFYISMAIGFALSFWGVCGSLLFKRSWRHAYFRFLDRSWEMLLAKAPIC